MNGQVKNLRLGEIQLPCERRLFLANCGVSLQAAVRARLGLVTPAVGEAAVQRGALQDQQPSGGQLKSGQQPFGRREKSPQQPFGRQGKSAQQPP